MLGGVFPPGPYGTREMGPEGVTSTSGISRHWPLWCSGVAFTDFRLAGKSGHPRRWHRCQLSANSRH
jgi:hypothetical protein